MPAGQEHDVTEVEPSGDPDDAAGQSWQTSDVAAMEDENLPPAQRVHALDPVSTSNLPAGQSVQAPIPLELLYLPASHAMHASVPPVYPGAHEHAASVAESNGEVAPVGHAEHASAPPAP